MNNQDFGKFINLLRKEKGLTQKELGERLNLTDKAISRWENGKSYPDVEMFERISQELDVSISELIACKKIETKEEAISVTEEAYIGEVKQGKKKVRKIVFALVMAILISISFFVVNIYGDNIYDIFVFSKSDVLEISKNEFRVSKNNTEAFEEYMLSQGWYYNGDTKSGVFENDNQKAFCTYIEKRFYVQFYVKYVDKIYPQLELMNVYGKGPYDIYYEKDKVIFSNEVDYITDKSTWTVVWSQNENTAEMQNAKLIVEENDQIIHEEDIDINIIKDENKFIHGWNCYVFIEPRFEVKCNNPKSAKAYVLLKDSNDIEYKVFLNRTDFHKENPNDASFDIIVKYKNSTFSLWDYYNFEDFINDKLNLS